MTGKTKVKPFFLTKADEKVFSEKIKCMYPSVKFVDDSRWSTAEPVVRQSIDECNSNYVFLWPSDVVDKLPTIPHGDKFDGPQSGVVMQFMRSKVKGGVLLSGQLGVGYSEKNQWMADWSKSIFKILNSLNVARLKTISDEPRVTKDYVVGQDSLNFFNNGGQLQYNSGSLSYAVDAVIQR